MFVINWDQYYRHEHRNHLPTGDDNLVTIT